MLLRPVIFASVLARPRGRDRRRVIDDVSLDVAARRGSSASSARTDRARRRCCGCCRARSSPHDGQRRARRRGRLRRFRARRSRGALAVVPQETSLAFDYTRARDRADGPLSASRRVRGRGAATISAAAHAALDATGTRALADRAFRTLSGGEKQRVVIASALAQLDPARPADRRRLLLLLDEPTASLDLRYQFEIGALLRRLHDDARHHDAAVDARSAFRGVALHATIVLLAGGRVLAQGRPAEVLTPALVGHAVRRRPGARRAAALATAGRREAMTPPLRRGLPVVALCFVAMVVAVARGAVHRIDADLLLARVFSTRDAVRRQRRRADLLSSRGCRARSRPRSSAARSPPPASSFRACCAIRWRRRTRSASRPARRSAR